MKFTLAISVVAALLPFAFADCCSTVSNGKCRDGTKGTPCCGYRSCNIFCCNCGGGCRHNRLANSEPAEALGQNSGTADIAATTEAFLMADTGSKGFVTLDDYLLYMKVESDHQTWVDWFKKHDKNQDGHITADEVATQ